MRMKEGQQMDKPLRDLIDIIHFTENVSAKIHGVLDEVEIYRIVGEEFLRSERYAASILLLTEDGSKLRIAEASVSPRKVKEGEKATGLRLRDYTIDLKRSSLYPQVVRDGKTVQAKARDIMGELLPQPLAGLISKIMGYDEKRTAILTPLRRHEEIIGTLGVSSVELAEHFIPSVRNLAQHISNALELADENIERKRAIQEIRRRSEELRALNEIGQAIGSTLNLTQVLKLVAQKTAQICNVERCSILLLDENEEELVPVMSQFASGAADAELWRIFREETYAEKVDEVPVIGEVIREGRTVVLDQESKSRLPQRWTEPFGIKSLLLVPLLSKDETIGLMALDYTTENQPFSAEQVNLAATIGGQVAIAIENASLYQEEMRRVFEMEALRRTTLDITSQLDVPQLLDSIVQRAAALARTTGGGLYLYHPGEEELELVVSHRFDKDYTGTCLKVGEGLSGKVMQIGQPLIVEDYTAWEGRSAKYEGSPFRAVLAVPLKWGEKIVGVLNVTDVEKPRAFSGHDLWLLELFANQAAIAIENARLHEATRQRVEQLSAIEEIAHELSSTLDFQKVIQLVLYKALEATDAPAGAIAVLDEKRTELLLLAHEGYPVQKNTDGHWRWSVDLGIVGRVIRAGELSVVDDISQDPDYAEAIPETQSQLTVPIIRENSVVGAIVLESPQLAGFSEEDAEFVQHLAEHAAVAMGNARLYEEQEQKLTEMTALRQTSLDIVGQLELPKLLRSIIERAASLLGAAGGGIYLYDPEDDELQQVVDYHSPMDFTGITLKVGEGVAGKVVQTGEALIVEDYRHWEGRSRQFDSVPFSGVIGVPLKWGNEITGAIIVSEIEKPRRFDDDDLRLLTLLANQAAIAIENARLYERLRESEERYRTYVEDAPDVIWETDANGRFTYWSPQIENLIGYTPEEMLGHTGFEFLIHPDDVDHFRSKTQQMLEEGKERYTIAYRALRRDGCIVHIETSIRPVWNDADEVVKYRGVARDVSERARLQAQLIQSAKLSGIGQMISGVAHELNNPLTTVMGYAQLLQVSDVDETIKEDLQMIYKDALRAQRIVQNLLTFARQKKPQRSSVDINEIIKRALDLRNYQLKVDNIEVVTELVENLPWTMADDYQLQQVFLNIINNAHQAMVQEKGRGTLTIRTEIVDNDTIRVSFTDTGPGIPSEALDKVFDPFFTTKEVGAGTGLGLSVSHGIIQEHKGRIWAESEPGQGAAFFVELPIKSWLEDITIPSPDEEPERAPSEGRRILVIDDERSIVSLMVRVLRESGYQVDGVTSAQLALKKLGHGRYDLIISDIRMPEMDGPTCEERVRATDPALAERIIFITGDLLSPSTQAFLEKWEGRFIKKPFDVERLRALVAEALS
jgi:two-component system NtrC family sensor kinase